MDQIELNEGWKEQVNAPSQHAKISLSFFPPSASAVGQPLLGSPADGRGIRKLDLQETGGGGRGGVGGRSEIIIFDI